MSLLTFSRSAVIGQMVFFAAMGTCGTVVHYSILIGLVQVLHVHPIPASTAGFTFGALTNYLLNYRFTFCSKKRHRETIGKFYTIAAIGMLFNALLMTLMVEKLSLHYLVAQVITTSIVFLWNFSGNRIWTFGVTGCGSEPGES